MTGTVFDIKEFAVFDGPGIRTTVFMKGCPLHCTWCHNPEGQNPRPELMVSRASCTHCGRCEAVCPTPGHCTACGKCVPHCRGGFRRIVGETWDSERMAARLLKDRDVYEMNGGGVTFSGGEPLMQWDFVADTIRRMPGIHTAIETSGFSTDDVFRDAMETCSLMMMDWKVSDPEMHKKYIGVPQDIIRRHLGMLCGGNTPFIVRMPMIPQVNDSPDHFQTVAEMVKDAGSLLRVEILPYQRAAGGKYEMVEKTYQPGFDESKEPGLFPDVFREKGIPFLVFR